MPTIPGGRRNCPMMPHALRNCVGIWVQFGSMRARVEDLFVIC